jgi:hypothetical protein
MCWTRRHRHDSVIKMDYKIRNCEMDIYKKLYCVMDVVCEYVDKI